MFLFEFLGWRFLFKQSPNLLCLRNGGTLEEEEGCRMPSTKSKWIAGMAGWAVLEAISSKFPVLPIFCWKQSPMRWLHLFFRCVGFRPTKTVLLNIGISTRAPKVKVQLLQDCGDRMNVSCTLTIEGRGFPKFHDVLFFEYLVFPLKTLGI